MPRPACQQVAAHSVRINLERHCRHQRRLRPPLSCSFQLLHCLGQVAADAESVALFTFHPESPLAAPNYKQQKKQREQAKKKKNDEKKQRKAPAPGSNEQERPS